MDGNFRVPASKQMLIHTHRQPKVMPLFEFSKVTQGQLPTAIIFRYFGSNTYKAVTLFKTLLSD
jgi:hypothetical protein